MKIFKTMLIAFLTLMFYFVFGQKKSAPEDYVHKVWTYEVETKGVGNDGTYLVRITDYVKTRKEPFLEILKRDAVHAVMFDGIPAGGGSVAQPALINDENRIEEPEFYMNDFFVDNGPYLNFVNDVAIASLSVVKMKKPSRFKVSVVISIKKDDLRKYLVDSKIIKSADDLFVK